MVAGIAIHTLPLGPMEGFVLSRIDASATVADIADLTSLDMSEVTRIVDKLIDLGAVEWADGAVHLPRMSAKSIGPPRATPGRPSQAPPGRISEVGSGDDAEDPAAQRAAVRAFPPPGRRRSSQRNAAAARTRQTPGPLPAAPPSSAPEESTAAPLPGDGIELALDRRQRIDNLYVALDLLDHYQVLDVKQNASKAEVRSAYFELSKVFHPDTAFRKNVGPYRSKMEAIFTRLTEAYDVLGKKKSREEYDAYLASIGETRDAEHALSAEHEVPAELRGPEASGEATASAPAPPVPAPAPEPLPARSTPTEEGKRVARELLQKRLGIRPPPSPAASAPVEAPAERTKKEVLRDLATSLKHTAQQTGGLDRLTRMIAEGHRAEERKDLAGAVRAFRFALALAPERTDVAETHERLARELAASLADRYEHQAQYEERHQKWGAAATSWAKVVDGRPSDAHALRRAALALLEAKGDLHRARSFAQRALELQPNEAQHHLALGRIFEAAGLVLNARRELEAARKLDPNDPLTQQLLKDLAQRPS